MLVHEFLEHSAQRLPDKVALICDEKRLTYAEIEDQANRLSNALKKQGLEKQDRVALFLENSAESVISIFATLKSGGIFLVLNPLMKARKVEYILNDSQARILITDDRRLHELSGILNDCPHLKAIIIANPSNHEEAGKRIPKNIRKRFLLFSECMKKYPSHRPPKKCIDIDLASLIYTSGSTGDPKGKMLTHLNMVSAANSIVGYLENIEEDILINIFPLSFDYGLYQVLMAFKFGGTIVLEKSFFYPYKMIEKIEKERVTVLPIVPTMAAILLRLKDLEKHDFSSVRCVTTIAQAMPPQFFSRLQKIFPSAKIYSMYGLTECKRVSYLPPEELERRPESVGKPMPNTEAYIVDSHGQRITEPGEIGELVVRGANVMRGYWNLPQETDRVLRPGPLPGEKVLYTGDLFKMDEEGFLYFVSRKDDMLKIAGSLVSPKEIENVLYEIEDVVEAAVVGVKDEILGQAVKAFIVLKEGSPLRREDISHICSQKIEKFMVPKYIEILDELPKSSHGKIARKDLI